MKEIFSTFVLAYGLYINNQFKILKVGEIATFDFIFTQEKNRFTMKYLQGLLPIFMLATLLISTVLVADVHMEDIPDIV